MCSSSGPQTTRQDAPRNSRGLAVWRRYHRSTSSSAQLPLWEWEPLPSGSLRLLSMRLYRRNQPRAPFPVLHRLRALACLLRGRNGHAFPLRRERGSSRN